MSNPDEVRDDEDDAMSIVPENGPDAEDRFRKYVRASISMREIARLIAEGMDPEEAVKQVTKEPDDS
jgi:hypothetical protein